MTHISVTFRIDDREVATEAVGKFCLDNNIDLGDSKGDVSNTSLLALHVLNAVEKHRKTDPHHKMLMDLGYTEHAFKYRTSPDSRSAIVQGVMRGEAQANPGNQSIYLKLTKWNRELLADEIITQQVFDENYKVVNKSF